MAISPWLFNGTRSEERIDDGRGDVPIPEDYPPDTVPLSSESPDTRLQTWERMAIRTFGSGAMDPGADQTSARIVKETWH